MISPMRAVRRSEVPLGEMSWCVAVTYCLFYNNTQLRQKPHFNHTGNMRRNHHNLCDLRKKKVDMETLAQKHGGSSPNAEPLCHNSNTPD